MIHTRKFVKQCLPPFLPGTLVMANGPAIMTKFESQFVDDYLNPIVRNLVNKDICLVINQGNMRWSTDIGVQHKVFVLNGFGEFGWIWDDHIERIR